MSDFDQFVSDHPTRSSVAPIKWRAQDGKVYERTGEKRKPKPGDLQWYDGTAPAPVLVPRQHYRNCTKRHRHRSPQCCHSIFCWCRLPVVDIWRLAADQSWEPPAIQEPVPDTLTELMRRVGLTAEALQQEPVPLLHRVQVLAELHQARELQRIANALDSLCARSLLLDGFQGTGSREIGFAQPASQELTDAVNRQFSQTPADEDGWVCPMCRAGEHNRCQITTSLVGLERCNCKECNRAPTYTFQCHKFEGMIDNHFCTLCGGGRLHPVHRV